MKIRALIGVWLVALMGLAMCGASLPDIGLSSNRGKMAVGLKTSLANGGGAGVDTTRIIVRDFLYPNTAARTAGYVTAADTVGAIVNQGTRGQAVRWGFVQRGATANTVFYDASAPYQSYFVRGATTENEDDYAWNASAWLGFIAINTNGMVPGDKIEKFDLIVNIARYETWDIAAGNYAACRLDTIAADQAMVTSSIVGYAADTDTARMDISWNEVNATGNVAWSPTLDTRLDRHDFGPRSNNVIGPGSYVAATPLRFDMRDAVQLESDRGNVGTGKWLIFVIYGTLGVTDDAVFSAGDLAANCGAGGAKGCPTAVIRTSSRRGVRPWAGTPVPLVFTLDDQYPVQVGYFSALEALGKTFDAAIYQSRFDSPTYAWVDSLHALKPNSFYFIHHSKTHPAVGGLTGAALDPEFARGWMMTELTGFTASDTTAIVDWAWPGGGAAPVKSLEAASRAVDFGYRAARGFGAAWLLGQPAFEYETYLGWSNWANRYAIKATGATTLFGSGAAFTEAQMAEELGDLIDLHYTDYGKAPIIIYGHRYDTAPADYISPAALTYLTNLAATLGSTGVMSYNEVLSMRFTGATAKTPAQVETGRGVSADSNAIQAFAASMDSAYAIDADPNYLQMWIGPK